MDAFLPRLLTFPLEGSGEGVQVDQISLSEDVLSILV